MEQAARYLAGRQIDASRLLRWFFQWAARYRIDRAEVSSQALIGIIINPGAGLATVVRLRKD